MSNGKVGRPRKPVVAKAKKIKLSKTQKQYAKMIHSIEVDLVKNQGTVDALSKKLIAITAELARYNAERQNLEGAKKNLEGILAQIPPPAAWTTFTKHVYEYHHHYHHHSPSPYPVYIGPWWQYYYGGGYLTYPGQSQLQWQNPNVNICDNPNVMGIATSGNLVKVTNTPGLPNSVVINGGSLNGGTSFLTHTSNLTGLAGFEATPTVNCSSSSFETPGITFTSSGASVPAGAPLEYTKADAGVQHAVAALQSFGFFDMGAPQVDAADLSVGDLLKTAAK